MSGPSLTTERGAPHSERANLARWWGALLVACVASRGAAAIFYIEDPDSLRFALSVAEGYDVAALQPHFPGYPVFWLLAKGFFFLTGSFSVAFSLVGGGATFALVWALLRLRGAALRSAEGAALAGLVLFNPLLWLMGTRYMPDLAGTALALATLVFLLRALLEAERRAAVVGMALAGLLAGLRLSYGPLVLPLALAVLWRGGPGRYGRGLAVAAGAAGVLAWLVPMTLDTGLGALLEAARQQTAGHFTDFGGTVQTEPHLRRRLLRMAESLWAGGLGAWWPGRHPLTAVVGLGVLASSAAAVAAAATATRGLCLRAAGPRAGWVLGCALTYALWVFFFQNVIHKTRHVLPLVPLLLLPLAAGGAAIWRRRGAWRAAAALFAAAYAAVALVLVAQHRQPTAIAQAKAFIQEQRVAEQRVAAQHGRRSAADAAVRVASIPLVNEYLRAQQVEARFFSVENSADVRRLRAAVQESAGRTLVIGTHPALFSKPPARTRTFYHNPYVNRMWPEVNVYVYD